MNGSCKKLVPNEIEEALTLIFVCPDNQYSKNLSAYYFMNNLLSNRMKNILSNKSIIISSIDALSVGAIFSQVLEVKKIIGISDATKNTIEFLMKALSIDESIPIYSIIIKEGMKGVDLETLKKELIYFYHMMSAHKTYKENESSKEITSILKDAVESDQRYWRTMERMIVLRCVYYSLITSHTYSDSYMNEIGDYLLKYEYPWYKIKYSKNQIVSLRKYIQRLNNTDDLFCIFALKYIQDKLSNANSQLKAFPSKSISLISYPRERLQKKTRNLTLNIFNGFCDSDYSVLDNNLRAYLVDEIDSILKKLNSDINVNDLNDDSFNIFFMISFAKLYRDIKSIIRNNESLTVLSLMDQFNQLDYSIRELTIDLNKQITILESTTQAVIRPNIEDMWSGKYDIWPIIKDSYTVDTNTIKYQEPFDLEISKIKSSNVSIDIIKNLLSKKFSMYSNVIIELFTDFEQLKLYNREGLFKKEYLIFPVFQQKNTGYTFRLIPSYEVLLNLYIIKRDQDSIDITVINFNENEEFFNFITDDLILLYKKFSSKSNANSVEAKQVIPLVKSFSMVLNINKAITTESLKKNSFIFIVWCIDCIVNGLSVSQISGIGSIFGEGKYFNYLIKNYYKESIKPYLSK